MEFNRLSLILNETIANEIYLTEQNLSLIILKKSTRQTFKSDQISFSKQKLAKLKSILTNRLVYLKKMELSLKPIEY